MVEQIREIASNRQSSREADEALAPFRDHSVWEALPAAEQARLVQRLVQRVEYDGREGKVAITFHSLDNQNSNGEPTSKENDR